MARLRNVLVANRGEIAVRILRAARARGARTTAVYSTADAGALHVSLADVAVPIGPPDVAQSYLCIDALLSAAREAGADAVHPGYGMLSESAAFARACAGAGLVFIGPSPETIESLGSKHGARLVAAAAGIACVPGYDGEDQSDERLRAEAQRIGFPVMVKAAAGGGGRGIRRVASLPELDEALARARSEARQAFGDERLILERALSHARHVEVQVLADAHGHVVHLGERDCSAQRRFQKLIEESPSPAVTPELRARMGEAAVRMAASAGYVGAGTVEFLLDQGGALYFLEMNTRLQVEHPVTELVTGVDLVDWQLRIAEGEPLTLSQAQLPPRGHAIEARLCAEDPSAGFAPATGDLVCVRMPVGEGIRVDHGLREGDRVGPFYDSMLAKIIAHGATREQARRRLVAALSDTCVLGVRTNRAFLRSVLDDARFIAGQVTTELLEAEPVREPIGAPFAVIEALVVEQVRRERSRAAVPEELAGFTNAQGLCWPVRLEVAGETVAAEVTPSPGGDVAVQLAAPASGRPRLVLAWSGETLWAHTPSHDLPTRDVTRLPPRSAPAQGSGRAVAPMDGALVEVSVRVGDRVTRGQTLAVVEAMKLQLRVCADVDGVVLAVHAAAGAQVKARALLVEVEPTAL